MLCTLSLTKTKATLRHFWYRVFSHRLANHLVLINAWEVFLQTHQPTAMTCTYLKPLDCIWNTKKLNISNLKWDTNLVTPAEIWANLWNWNLHFWRNSKQQNTFAFISANAVFKPIHRTDKYTNAADDAITERFH